MAAVRFLLDGRIVSVPEAPATQTVLEYLREVAGRAGTKEGCAEGDCGACTVALGELSADGAQVRYRAINSCIRLLPSIDGQELVTVESLAAADEALHPVQQALVDHHGSQCGFCTPGFVMSLFALYLEEPEPTRARLLETLSGNLCRCTGYRPILEAGARMGDYAAPARWGREAVRAPDRLDALRSLRREQALSLPGWLAPRSIEELASAFAAQPDAVLLAGGTDVGLWVTKQLRELPAILYIGEIEPLKRIQYQAEGLTIGAAVSLTDAWAALVREYPPLAELAQRFGSPPVRNSGTLCGNIANGSPIGDSMPALIALEATLTLRCGSRTRRLPLERFYLGYQRTDLAPGEFIVAVTVPRARAALLAGYKVSKRIDQDISAVCAVFALELEGDTVRSARLAFGGMAAVPARAPACEQALTGERWCERSIERAAAALATDFRPLTDLRASRDYRLETAGNLLRRFYLEHGGTAAPVRTAGALAASG